MTHYTVYSHAERPELMERRITPADVWPQFMLQDPVARQYWHYLYEYFPECQLYLCNEAGDVVGEGNSIPITWDGKADSLPDEGWDATFVKCIEDYRAKVTPNTLCGLWAMVAPSIQGSGISRGIIYGMRDAASAKGFNNLIAPFRPSLKALYPLIPMERYVHWARHDGAPFDPWLRVQWRLGAQILKIAPRSKTIPGTVADWESWAGMDFPETGSYIVPGALVPVQIDRERDEGLYVEPNLWMIHTLVDGNFPGKPT